MKRLLDKLYKFTIYLWGKKSELRNMDERDMLLAKVVVDIHRKKSYSEFVFVPLFSVYQIHPINRKNSLRATQKRIRILQKNRDDLLKCKKLSRELVARYLPSVSSIKAVQEGENSYIAYEGNGRLVALQTVFSPDDKMYIEIEEYCFSDASKIIQQMNKVRKLHGLTGKCYEK